LSDNGNDTPHVPGPSLWPIAFAVGVACLLLGLVISWIVALVGAILVVVFGLLWARDVTREVRGEVPYVAPEARAVDAGAVEGAVPETLPGFTRSGFLEASLIGLSGVLGAVLTLPVLGFMVLPSFTDVEEDEVDLGSIGNFPVGQYMIATYLALPEQGEVTRRTAFVRNNGPTEGGEQSFTILYSRCVHLGCPVQPNGPIDEAGMTEVNGVELRPVLAQSFGCPCHGGLYDAEGNRQAGPPVRSMDRYSFSIRNGNLVLGELFAVGNVSGAGASATISRYPWSVPGTHVDGIEAWLYPIVPSQVTG
jgi:menaquinol-cytochrome c reductase iron-sulfur subunit